MRIFVTGDLHGYGWGNRFKNLEKMELCSEDILFICGDFGGVWRKNSETDIKTQEYFERMPWTTCFIDGNHENFALLNSYPIEEWHGGKVHRINDHLLHLMRGQFFDFNGFSVFTMGGAISVDKYLRTENVSWWREEEISNADMAEALKNLDNYYKNGRNKIDLVLTHAAPQSLVNIVGFYYEKDAVTSALEFIYEKLLFRRWYCGHYHINREMGKFRFLFDDVVEVISPKINSFGYSYSSNFFIIDEL